MKKNVLFVLLLSVVSLAVSAKDEKIYKNYQDAANASHEILKEGINGQHVPNQIKKLNKKNNFSKPSYKYQVVSTSFVSQANENKRNGQLKKEAQKWAFKGDLTVSDSKTKDKLNKYVANGYFTVSKDSVKVKVNGQKKKQTIIVYNEDHTPVFDPQEPTLVPYFERDAVEKAKSLVNAYYKSHPEFVDYKITKVEPCEEGYKLTTSRTLYRDKDHYTGNKGTVIFTVQKDSEKLDDFKLLEDKTVEDLTEFDNTPAPVEPAPEETTSDEITDNRTSLEKLEQAVVNGFKINSVVLSDENKEQLDQAAQVLLSDKDIKIDILGHSCSLGDEETNYNFGLMRAKSAKEYLVSKGVEQNRISVHSYGAKKPLAPNTTEENRAQNRRVEIKVVK